LQRDWEIDPKRTFACSSAHDVKYGGEAETILSLS
jgi:hypothetical protein